MQISTDFTFIILTHNRITDCLQVINSLFRFSDFPPRVIVVDNSQTRPIGRALKKYEPGCWPITYIRAKENDGLYSLNLGFEMAWKETFRSPFLAVVHDDIIVNANWEREVLRSFKTKNTKAVGPWGWEAYPKLHDLMMRKVMFGDSCEYLEGGCFFLRHEERFKIHPFWKGKTYYGHAPILFKILLKGGKVVVCRENLFTHRRRREEDLPEDDPRKCLKEIQRQFGKRMVKYSEEKRNDANKEAETGNGSEVEEREKEASGSPEKETEKKQTKDKIVSSKKDQKTKNTLL